MDKQKNYILQIIPDVIALFVIALLMIFAALCLNAPGKYYSEAVTDLTAQWQDADGRLYALDALPEGDLTLTHDLSGIDTENQRLCLKSVDTFFTVSADGVVIYDYAPEQPQFLGRSYGKYLHMIPLPPGTKALTLSVHPIFPDTSATLKEVVIEDAGKYMGDLYQKALPAYSVCLLMFMFGVMMLFMGITTRNLKSGDNLNFFALGTFAILVGLWSVNETYLLQVVTQFARFLYRKCNQPQKYGTPENSAMPDRS